MSRISFLFIFKLFILPVFAQVSDTNCALYSRGFMFDKGVYRTFEEFRFNNPSFQEPFKVTPKSIHEQDENYNQEYIYYFNHNSNTYEKIESFEIWGYTDGTSIFRLYDGAFFRIENIVRFTNISKVVSYEYQKLGLDEKYHTKFKSKDYTFFYDLETDRVYNTLNLDELEYLLRNSENLIDPERKKSVNVLMNEYNLKYPICFPVFSTQNEGESDTIMILPTMVFIKKNEGIELQF